MAPTQPTWKVVSAATHHTLVTISNSVATQEEPLRNKWNICTLCVRENTGQRAIRSMYSGESQQPPSKRGTEYKYNKTEQFFS